jgi:LCP family protein required for cell wall assembly
MAVDTPRRPPSPQTSGGGAPGRRRDPLWAKLTIVLGALLMLGSGAGIVGSRWLIGAATSTITQQNLLGDTVKPAADVGRRLDGPIDLLLLGVDTRVRLGPENTRSDSIIMAHVPASHDRIYLVSLPRDTRVRAPAFPKSRHPGGVAKLTEVFNHGSQNGAGFAGGVELVAKTIRGISGVAFDGAAIIDFSGFKGVIEELGGVRMCVDQQVTSIHMFWVDGKPTFKADARRLGRLDHPVVHKKGCRTMAAWEALDFARQRHLEHGDYDRQRHQQQLIKAIARKATAAGVTTRPAKLSALLKAAGKAFILDTGGVPIADFVFTLRGITSNDMVMLRTNGGTFASQGGYEILTPQSLAMLRALKEDRLGQFVLDHPEVLAPDAAPADPTLADRTPTGRTPTDRAPARRAPARGSTPRPASGG